MPSTTFVDVHCHVLGLTHPDFLGYAEGLRHRGLETIYSQISSPNFILGGMFTKGGERIRNLMAVMEMEAGEVFMLMEDDLAGRFDPPGSPPPPLSEGRLRIGDGSYDRLLLVPLVVDFARSGGQLGSQGGGGSHYSPTPRRLETQVQDLLAGIAAYRRERPRGFLEIRPFFGLNPARRNLEEIAVLLEGAFAKRDEEVFIGLKLYPPLGFDPDPPDAREAEKADYIWAFCEKRGLPLVTHCDDQGFRTLPLEESWRATSPARWRRVLERHPDLVVDFAHFGRQYAIRLGQGEQTEWSEEILRLMAEFPGVYADLSFNGVEADYYQFIFSFLMRRDPGTREIVLSRLMFGSDFMLNLLKIRSYADYFDVYSRSRLPEEWKRRFAVDNPLRFLRLAKSPLRGERV